MEFPVFTKKSTKDQLFIVDTQQRYRKMKKITEGALRAVIRKMVREQIDMRSKQGRELKEMAERILRSQEELEAYNQSIRTILDRQKELSKEVGRNEKALFSKMNELDVKTFEISERVVAIEEEAKYRRVEPGYKDLYERAVTELSRFSQAQANLLEETKEAEISLKKAEKVQKLKLHPKTEGKINEQVLGKIGGWIKGVFNKIMGSITRATKAADRTLGTLDLLAGS